jgi:hypothetical protein
MFNIQSCFPLFNMRRTFRAVTVVTLGGRGQGNDLIHQLTRRPLIVIVGIRLYTAMRPFERQAGIVAPVPAGDVAK